MRFVSPHAKYRINLREPIYRYFESPGSGTVEEEVVSPLIVKFERDYGVRHYELEAALEHFKKQLERGLPAAEDTMVYRDGRFHTAEGVRPLTAMALKVSVFDTDDPRHGYDAETKAFVARAPQPRDARDRLPARRGAEARAALAELRQDVRAEQEDDGACDRRHGRGERLRRRRRDRLRGGEREPPRRAGRAQEAPT